MSEVKDYPPYLDYPLKSANSFFGCGINNPRCKEDCYWYGEWQDMNAHIPYCKCKNVDFIEPKDCSNCEQYHSKSKPTNADRFRAMSDEELAKAFVAIAAKKRPSTYTVEGFCLDDGEVSEADWLSWLKSPVDKEGEG